MWAHYTRISEFHLSTETFEFSDQFSKNDFCVYYFVHACSFITAVQRTVEKQQLQRRLCRKISVVILTFIAGFLQMDFDTNPVNSFLTSVLPVILKEIKSNFLVSTLRLFKKLSHKKPSS